MSLYVYECWVCLNGSEKIQHETEKPAPRCEWCGGKMRLNLIATEVAKDKLEEAK